MQGIRHLERLIWMAMAIEMEGEMTMEMEGETGMVTAMETATQTYVYRSSAKVMLCKSAPIGDLSARSARSELLPPHGVQYSYTCTVVRCLLARPRRFIAPVSESASATHSKNQRAPSTYHTARRSLVASFLPSPG